MPTPGAHVAELLGDIMAQQPMGLERADDTHASDDQPLLFAVLDNVLRVWGDAAAIESVSHSVHVYHTVLVVALAGRISPHMRATRGMEVVTWMMKVRCYVTLCCIRM